MYEKPRYLLAGDRCIIVEFADKISNEANLRVRNLSNIIQRGAIDGTLETVCAYVSLMVYYDPLIIHADELIEKIEKLESKLDDPQSGASRLIEIPVCYGGEKGPDLEELASYHNLSVKEVINMQSSAVYNVYFLGFTPGFPYLGGLPEKLATPRLTKPRTLVPRGSVGIGGSQCVIYSVDSPGGFRLIGKTPLKLFDPFVEKPFLLEVGDEIKFKPITDEEFDKIHAENN